MFQELLLVADLPLDCPSGVQLKGSNPFPGFCNLFEPYEACDPSPSHSRGGRGGHNGEFYEPSDHGYLGKSPVK